MDVNGDGGENLTAFLESIGLQSYHNAIRDELKVETVHDLKQVKEQDLEDIRMKPEDIQRLRKNIKKEFPQNAFGKLKKMNALHAVTRRISFKRLTRSSSETAAIRNSRSGVISTDMDTPQSPVPVVGRRIIPMEQIVVQNDIGEGEFGVVRHGLYTNDIGQKIDVAVKSLSQDRLEHGLQEFLKEATSMQSVSHSNIVTFYGIVFQQDKELMLVTEYAPLKSLQECLHNESLRSVLNVNRLCTYAHQVATGMTYLEAQGLIHRDLAARNILVFSHHKVKIGDFGLSRALGLDKEYYQSKYRTDLKIPIAWCAPECINLLRFSSASDVWSFGVTMWEMFTYGKKPWDGLTSAEILQSIDNPKNERLERPALCPTEHYELMLRCWSHRPEDRPKFASITSELTSIKPTLMKAIRANSEAPGVIQFNEGDNIIVIDKKPADAPTWQYWFGVNKAGQSGFFNPTDCVPVQAESSPLTTRQTRSLQPPPKKSMKKQSSSSSRSPKNPEKKRFTADMIGKPQNDLRHTGHIGYDGITFGEIPSIGSDPMEKLIPIKGGGSSDSSTLKSSHSDTSGGGANTPVVVAVGSTKLSNGDRPTIAAPPPPTAATAVTSTQPPTNNTTDNTITDSEDLSDFQFPDLSLSESLSFGTSFIDDMMREFKSGERYANTNENNNSSKLFTNGDSSNSSSSHSTLPGTNLKSMSAADEKMINDAIELANQLASSSLSQANTPKDFDDEPVTPTKSKHRFHFKFPGTKKTSPKILKRTFSDDLASKAAGSSAAVTPEAEQAYNMLVAKGPHNSHHTGTANLQNKAQDVRLQGDRASSQQLSEPSVSAVTRTRRHSANQQTSQTTSSRNSMKNAERPKERPPLPPIQVGDRFSNADHDDVSDIPSTPPPPIPVAAPHFASSRVPVAASLQPVYDNMDAFWSAEMKMAAFNAFDTSASRGSRSEQIRRIQKLMGKEVSDAECWNALESTDGQAESAIKYLKLKQLAKLRLAGLDHCKVALMSCQWNVQKAADFILDRKGSYVNDVVGV